MFDKSSESLDFEFKNRVQERIRVFIMLIVTVMHDYSLFFLLWD